MLGIYKYYKQATVDYRLQRLVKPGFYQLIPLKKVHPASSDTLHKFEQGGVLLPVKLLVSVTFVPLLTAYCVSTTGKTESSSHLRSSEVSGPILLTIPTVIILMCF